MGLRPVLLMAVLISLFTSFAAWAEGRADVRADAGDGAAKLLDDLYSKRLLFADSGAPLVPVGMMQGRTRVELSAEAPLVMQIDDAVIHVPARARVVVEWQRGKPARTRELQVVETLEGDRRLKKRDAIAAWQKKGVGVEALDVGGVYGVKGTVVDNRAVLLAARGSLAPGIDARPVPVEWLERVPATWLRVFVEGGHSAEGRSLRAKAHDGAAVLVRQVEHSVGYAEHGFEDRQLRGEVLIVADKQGKLAVVNLVDEDTMVAGVLPSEMFATAPLEALKAQAVTARGELFAKIGRRHFADPHQVCSEQHCQVYRGLTAESPRTNEAAVATSGELAFVGDKLVDSVYSACCGGHTEPADVVWDRPIHNALRGTVDDRFADPAARPWLQPAAAPSSLFARVAHEAGGGRVPPDLSQEQHVRAFLALPRAAAFCGRSSFNQKGDAWRWQRRFLRAELDVAFADLGVGEVRRLLVEGRGPGGRLRALVVQGQQGTARVFRELPVRRRLGNLRSGLFVIDEERDQAGRLVAVTLRGAGFGHGSGMCQQGAIGMAEAGYDYRAILRHYYAGADVRRVF